MRGVVASTSMDDLWKGMEWWKDLSPSQHEISIVLGAAAIVGALAVFWAVFIRKPEKDGSRRYVYPSSRGPSSSGSDRSSFPEKKRRRRRRRRRHPTLAETGGLPPIRSESLPDDPP
jgi:hypothetical protein